VSESMLEKGRKHGSACTNYRAHRANWLSPKTGSERARTGDLRSLCFPQDRRLCLPGLAFFGSAGLYSASCSRTGYVDSFGRVAEQDVQRGASAGVAAIHSGNRNPS